MGNIKFRVSVESQRTAREIDLSKGLFDGNEKVGGEITQDFLRERGILKATIPYDLYHYTTASGFFGIASSGALWASNYSYLNDSLETKYLFSLIQKELRVLIQREGSPRIDSRIFDIETFGPSRESCFICSFSENGDQLSQWRGYAEGGYSIGFPSGILESVQGSTPFQIARCIYDEEIAKSVATHLAEILLEEISNVVDEAELRKLLSKHRLFAWKLSPFFKHPSFAEEKEWRVFRFESHYAEGILRRPSSAGLISYVNIPVFDFIPKKADASKPNDDIRIVCSPGLSSEREREEPDRLITELQGVHAISRLSVIPYRST
jgi:hypothetical protein